MSSLRIRTKNKLLTVLGAAKPSTNVAYDLAFSDFESALQRLVTLDTALKTYTGFLKSFHSSASSVVGAIDSLSFGGIGTASFQQKAAGSSEMQQFAGEARVACADVDMMVLKEVSERLEKEVLLPVRGWLQHARGLQNEAISFLEHKELYDHYSRKVATLRESHEKRSGSGRHDKSKDTERMFRNEQKLAAATQEYTRLSDTVIRNLRAFVTSRDAALAPLLRRVLCGRVLYADRMQEATGRIRALIEDDQGEDDEVLNHFTSVAQGGSVDSAVIMAAASAHFPAPCTVRKSSFEEFVGESPTKLSTQHKAETRNEGWGSFEAPPEQEMHMPSPTNGGFGVPEPHYTPPHSVPVNTPPKAANGSWAGEFSTLPTNMASSMAPNPPSSPTSLTNPWDTFPSASAPSADSFPSGEWSASVLNQTSYQQQLPVTEFRDIVGGDFTNFR